MYKVDSESLIRELESLKPFEDYKESFYNKDDYEEEYEMMSERDLKNDI